MKTEMLINRTINNYTATVICFDCQTGAPTVKDFAVSGKVDAEDKEAVLKALRKDNETERLKLCAVTGMNKNEKLYSLPVSIFIDNAIIPYDGEKLKGRWITRTIAINAYKCVVWMVAEKKMGEQVLTVKGKALEEPLKDLRKRYEGQTMKVVDVLEEVKEEQLYAIRESEFVALAEKYASESKAENK